MPRRCKGPPKYKKPYDWEKIREDWLTSPHERLLDFARERGIVYDTARRKLKLKEKQELQAQAARASCPSPAGIENALNGAEVVVRRRVYVKSLEKATKTVDQIRDRALSEFNVLTKSRSKLKWRTPAEAGNLALRAADMSREFSAELQGIPREDDTEAWQITRKFWPLRYQRDFIFDTPATLKQEGRNGFIFAFIGGLGSGKTFCGGNKSGDMAWRNRGLPGAIYAPTYRMLEDPSCAKHRFLETLADKGLSFRYHASQNKVTIFGDTEVLFRSMDEPEHLRGPELAWVWIDEGLQMPTRKAFDVIIGRVRGRKGDPNRLEAKEPCVIFTGTANGLNWGYDLLVEEADANDVILYHGRTQDNVMIDPNYYLRLSRLYDERFAKQELEGEFIDVHRGRAYFAFSRQEHKVDVPIKKLLDPTLPLDLCVDFNVTPLCWNICQDFRHNGDSITYCLDEIHLEDANTDDAMKEFIERYGAHKGGVRVYGDATWRARHTSTSRTDYEIVVKGLEAKKIPGVEICIGKSNPLVTDRINSTNGRLRSATGNIRFYILSHCKETIKDFERTTFIPGTRQLDKAPKRAGGQITGHSHHTDAVSYKIDRDYPVRKIHVRQQ